LISYQVIGFNLVSTFGYQMNKMTTRSKTSGEVAISLRNNCFEHHAAKMWNKCPTLRAAASKSEAKSVAAKLARDSPT
jgi:hypothetical protein